GVGVRCTNQNGACAGGLTICKDGVIKCDKSGSPETCNAIDDNCDGTKDEGDPGGGAKCGTDLGECVAGQFHCNATSGVVECFGFIDHTADPELCDGKDNDCDGNFDENIGSLGNCGPTTNDGECNIGSLMCSGGSQTCVGAIFPKFETCNNKDDDCDNLTDEIFNKQTDIQNCGTCGTICQPTSKTCINTTNNTNGTTCTMDSQCTGGTCAVNSQPRCVTGGCTFSCNAGFQNKDGQAANGCEFRCFATGAEECDGIDNDCDGNTDEGLTPPALCLSGGECGATAPVAQCTGAGGWTCTYPGVVQFPETLCDGKNNDCDANTDEAQPNLGAACSEVPETNCTGVVDDDNDGFVNDGCPAVGPAETGTACNDLLDNDNDGLFNDGCPAIAERGVCQSFGTYTCNPANLNGPAKCTITTMGQPPSAMESCDDKDNDCDGNTDEGASTGSLLGQEWVDIGGGKQMMKYEASKPDASATDPGARSTIACSKSGVKPWTNVTYQQALAACQSVGASLCTESTWHRTCSVVTPLTYPLGVAGAGNLIEAEDYSSIAFGQLDTTAETGLPNAPCANTADDDNDGWVNDGCPAVGPAETVAQCANGKDDDNDGVANDGCASRGQTRSWVPDYTAGFSSISALEASPNTGTTVAIGSATTQAARVDYLINFTTTGTYHVWLKMFANNANDNQVYVGLNTAAPPQAPTLTVTLGTNNAWTWVDAGTFVVGATGNRYLSVYMGDDGTKLDQVYLVTGTGTPPNTINSKGSKWAYATNPDTYQPTTCNGDDYDTSAAPGDQDDVLIGGTLASCKSTTGGGVFDMSGNVKEWTLAHAPGENPIRGGASNNTAEGISCPLNFTLADDAFYFPNIGFRCCR
ncbi:MAG TPA: MopE-related protein, partial [Kofleriaceae bacterium]